MTFDDVHSVVFRFLSPVELIQLNKSEHFVGGMPNAFGIKRDSGKNMARKVEDMVDIW